MPDSYAGMKNVFEYLNALSLRFSEVHYFICQRTASTINLVKSVNGSIVRSFCMTDEFLYQTGTPTNVEIKLGIPTKNHFECFSDDEWDSFKWSDIEEIIQVAQNCSINPMNIESCNTSPKHGYLIHPENIIFETNYNKIVPCAFIIKLEKLW